jgi:hypothetical protein
VTVAIVPFSGRAGTGGRTGTIKLPTLDGDDLVEVEQWTHRDALCCALEAPIWDRFGTFVEHPRIVREVIWSTEDRGVLIRGRRSGSSFEELAA